MDIKNNKENVSINIQTEVRPGKITPITVEIPLKSTQQQTESIPSFSIEKSTIGSLEKDMSQIGFS